MSVLITAMIMILGLAVMSEDVSAEEYEKNIILSCESKDIDINEIPEDRTVDLLVSIENNPGFVFLGMAFDYDKRLDNNGTLDIFNWDYVKILEPEYGKQWKVQPCSFSIFDETGYLLVQTSSVGMNNVYNEDGPLYKLSFRIPDDAVGGDEYKINFVRKDDWNTRLTFLPNDHEKYNDEYFSTLNNGVIRIVGNNQSDSITEPIITEKQEDNNFEEKVTYSESETNNESENTEEKKEQTSAITVNSSVISTSDHINSQTSISTKTKESDVISSSSVSVQIISGKPSETSCVTTVSDTVTTLTEINEKSKGEKNILPIIIVSAAVIVSGAVLIIIKRKSDNG